MQSDPRIMRLNLKKLKEGINIKTTSLKSVKKKLKQVTRNNEMKQKELEELKKRYSETLLKLQIGTEEAQLLSKEVKDLKGTAGDATVAELRQLAHDIIKQYVEEVRDDILARKYKVFKGDVYDRVLFNEDDAGDSDEDDNVPISAKDVTVPHLEDKDVVNIGSSKKSRKDEDDFSLARRGLGDDDEKEGAHLPFHHDELESKNSDDEGNEDGNPQGASKKNDGYNDNDDDENIHSEHIDILTEQLKKQKDAEDLLKDEIEGGSKWLEKRHKKQIKHVQGMKQVEVKEVVVLYTEADGIGGESVYQCVIRVQDGATFHDIIDESCAHWGLMPDYTFLEDNVSRTIWPGNAIVEDEIPLDRIRPELHLVFVQNLKLNELVILTKRDQERKDVVEKIHQAQHDNKNNESNNDDDESKDEEKKNGENNSAAHKKKGNLAFIKDDNGEFIHNKELYADPNTLPGGMANVSYICIYKHTNTHTYIPFLFYNVNI